MSSDLFRLSVNFTSFIWLGESKTHVHWIEKGVERNPPNCSRRCAFETRQNRWVLAISAATCNIIWVSGPQQTLRVLEIALNEVSVHEDFWRQTFQAKQSENEGLVKQLSKERVPYRDFKLSWVCTEFPLFADVSVSSKPRSPHGKRGQTELRAEGKTQHTA